MYTEVKTAWRVFVNPLILNQLINKRTAGIIWKCKGMYIYKEKFEDKYAKDKKHCKVRDHCNYKLNIEVLHIIYVI